MLPAEAQPQGGGDTQLLLINPGLPGLYTRC